jgi:hypothetical protein
MHLKNTIYQTVRSGHSSSLPSCFRCKGETDITVAEKPWYLLTKLYGLRNISGCLPKCIASEMLVPVYEPKIMGKWEYTNWISHMLLVAWPNVETEVWVNFRANRSFINISVFACDDGGKNGPENATFNRTTRWKKSSTSASTNDSDV